MPRSVSRLAFLFPLLAALGCRSDLSGRIALGPEEGILLARERQGDAEVTVRLFPEDDRSARLHVTTRRVRRTASLGLDVSSIGTEMARSLGRPPWRGVLVLRAAEGSAADRAGVRAGDIVLEVDGVEVVAAEHFRELVEAAAPGRPISITLLRAPPGQPAGEREVVRLAVRPDVREETETTSETLALEPDRGVFEATGLQVAEIPRAPSLPPFLPSGSPLVTGVLVGSPAYEAGFRAGDRVVAIDGSAPAELPMLRARLRAHAEALGLDDVLSGVDPIGSGDPPVLRVEGPPGAWEAPLGIRPDLREKVSVHVPILFEYESTVARTRWSFLDFVFQFGMNYEHRLLPSRARRPNSRLFWSLFPLGMFEYERSPSGLRITLFWLFTIRSQVG